MIDNPHIVMLKFQYVIGNFGKTFLSDMTVLTNGIYTMELQLATLSSLI